MNCNDGATLLKDKTVSTPTPGGILPCFPGNKGLPLVVPIFLSAVDAISHIRVFLPKDLRQDQARDTVWKSVLEVQRRFPDGIALLDPVENMDIKDEKFTALVNVSLRQLPTHRMELNTMDRKLMSWSKKCSQIHCTMIPVSQKYTLCTPKSRRLKQRYGI